MNGGFPGAATLRCLVKPKSRAFLSEVAVATALLDPLMATAQRRYTILDFYTGDASKSGSRAGLHDAAIAAAVRQMR